MEETAYAIEHEAEQSHWWFVCRRYLFRKIIKRFLDLDKHSKIMDVGSSAGTNLRLLKNMGFNNYHGLDISKDSKQFCAEKNLGEVYIADIQKDNLLSARCRINAKKQ